jgi:hypothetical protein
MVKRAARRKNKEKLRNYIDNEINVWYNEYTK